jgi:hypothetical protein
VNNDFICCYDSRHLKRGVPATQVVDIGTATPVPMCDDCAERRAEKSRAEETP